MSVHVFPFEGTPQDLQTSASPTFVDLTLTNDLLINTGGIINWGSGDAVLTHSAGNLRLTGGASITVDRNEMLPDGIFRAKPGDTNVQPGDDVGTFDFASNENSSTPPVPTDDVVARIRGIAEAQHTTGHWPTNIVFSTVNSSNVLTERWSFMHDGHLVPSVDSASDLGSTTSSLLNVYTDQIFVGSGTDTEYATEGGVKNNPHFQQNSTAFDAATFGISRWDTAQLAGGRVVLGRSRGGAVGTNVIVQDDDRLGVLVFAGDDGAGLEAGAAIYAEADGAPGSGDMPGRLVFAVTADGAAATTEAARIDNQRNLLLGGTVTGASSVGNLHLFNGTAPTGSVAGGAILYTEDVSASAELKVRDEAGNITTLSPHNDSLLPDGLSEPMAWSHYSERDGRAINVDMLAVVRAVEKLSGRKLVYERAIH